jgi:hypothetical protein
MNPYEEPKSSSERAKSLDWFLIGQAAVVYFVTSVVCSLILNRIYRPDFKEPSFIAVIILSVLPWIIGAIYLARHANHFWAIHGLIYSLIPPTALFINNVVKAGLFPELFPAMLIWQLSSTAVTMFTMVIIRFAIKTARAQSSSSQRK